jgi:hypothetical protein
MTAREAIAEKAARYLAKGRLTVTRVSGDLADAIVRSDSGEHHVSHDPAGWHCTCPARGRCSHAEALRLVTVRRRRPGHPRRRPGRRARRARPVPDPHECRARNGVP